MHAEKSKAKSSPPAAEQQAEGRSLRDVLIFEFGGELYAIAAASVDGVVAWKPPTAVPGADARIRGVIQDRGRVVVVMAHPSGQSLLDQGPVPSRVIICSIQRRLIGLPASATLAVEAASISHRSAPRSQHDSHFGSFVYLDTSQYEVSELG